MKNLVNLDQRNTNKEIVCIKNYEPFLYICILSLVLQICEREKTIIFCFMTILFMCVVIHDSAAIIKKILFSVTLKQITNK